MRALLRARRGELLGLERVSAVVPALDAEAGLAACLAALAGAGETIVVDGGSRDGTVAIAEAAGARVLVAPKGRGVQLAAGAAAATGDWLLFVHADTILGPGWREAAAAHVALAADRPACFRLRLDHGARAARLIERGVALRTRLLGLPYGDQGLLVSRAAYDRAGGYAPLPLFEDVDLVRRLPRPRLLEAEALTSARRWREQGWLRRSGRNLLLLGRYYAGADPRRLAEAYERSRPVRPG